MSDLDQVNIRLSKLESRIDLLEKTHLDQEQAHFYQLERQMLAPPIGRSAAVAAVADDALPSPPPELSRESSNSSAGEEDVIKATEIKPPKKSNRKKESGLLLKFTVPNSRLDDALLVKAKDHYVFVSSIGLQPGGDASFMIATDSKHKPIFPDKVIIAKMLDTHPPISELERRLNNLRRGGSKRNKIQKKRSTRKKTDCWF